MSHALVRLSSKQNDIILKPLKNLIPSILVGKNVNSSLCPVAAGTFGDLQISSQVLHGSRELTSAMVRGLCICLKNTGWDKLDRMLMLSCGVPAV